MKAILFARYGSPSVLRLEDLQAPSPTDDEALVRIYAASVNPVDFHQMRGHVRFLTGLRAPKQPVLGCDIAGRVEAVGANVKHLQPGDDVFGISSLGGGGFAEYACARQDRLALKPANVSYEEAAAVPIAGTTALQGLRDHGRIEAGQKVLIDGASGGVGTFAVQIAKSFGAEVTAVCSSSKIDTALSLGADHVMDYAREDFTKSGALYDLIFGANAYHSVFEYRRSLTPRGTFIMAGGGANVASILGPVLLGPILSLTGHQRFGFFIAKVTTDALNVLGDLLATGKIRPVIDRCYPLSAAAEAMEYLEEGHARGKIVLRVGADAAAAG